MRNLEERIGELDKLLDSINDLGDIIAVLNDPDLQSDYTEQLLSYSEQFDSLCKAVKADLEEYLDECRASGAPVSINHYRMLKVINERNLV